MNAEFTYVVILTTTETEDDARRIAESLVNRRLVACAQITPPIRSIYRWMGNTVDTLEYRIACKTLRARTNVVFEAIRQLHPYQTPQLVAVPITDGSSDYLRWIDESVAPEFPSVRESAEQSPRRIG